MKSTYKPKHVVVTGACGGMGQAVCTRLSQKGCQVIGLDVRLSQEAKPLADGEMLQDGDIRYLACDVTDIQQVKQAFLQVKNTFGDVDAVVHTAGIYDLDSLVEISEERMTRIFGINFFGVYRVNKEVLPLLSQQARVVMVTSELAPTDPLPFTGLYGVTKCALEKYAASLRMELNLLGKQVVVIRPGAVKTGLLGDSTSALDKFCQNTALYACNAKNFKAVVNSIEAKSVSPERIADKAERALFGKRPKLVYNVNRNPLLRLYNLVPNRLQAWIIKMILK